MKPPIARRTTLLLIVSMCVVGLMRCGPAYTAQGAVHRGAPDSEVITKSLFDDKDRTISEEDIQRLLNGKIVLPESVRLAIFKHTGQSVNRYYANYSADEEYLKTQQSFMDTLIAQVSASKRVKKVVSVPSLMTTTNPNITQLRETAVRLQADLLLVFSVTSDIYYKYRLFDKNEAKAFATIEVILMDTRTGVIPYSNVVTREKLVTKISTDLDNSETRKRAELGAVLLALQETGRGVAGFFETAR